MQKTVIVTGVTGAIGKATALEIAKTKARVILLARNKAKLEAVRSEIIQKSGNNDVETLVADLSDTSSIRSAAAEFKQKHQRLDALVNVAAIYKAKREVNGKGQELMFATNHLGVFTLTNQLLDTLKASTPSRVVTVAALSKTTINFDDLQGERKFSAFNAFGASKMMNLQFTYALADKLRDSGVSATLFNPGVVKSEIINEMPGVLKLLVGLLAKAPDRAARTLSELAVGQRYAGVTGKFFDLKERELKSAPHSYDKAAQEKLWEASEKLEA